MVLVSSGRQHVQAPVTGLRILSYVALSASLIVPLLDAHALESDPYHMHVVAGGSPAAQAQALAAHLRHRVVPIHPVAVRPASTSSCGQADRTHVCVLSIGSGDGSGSFVVGLANGVAGTSGRLAIPRPHLVGPYLTHALVRPLEIIVAVPDPPPRGF